MEKFFYFAPMEGITGYIYRSAHSRHFRGADCYVTPFIASNQSGRLKTRDKNDILPEHNQGIRLLPQRHELFPHFFALPHDPPSVSTTRRW